MAGDAVASALFYLVTYALTSFGTWAVVIALEKAEGKGLEIADYAGLGRKRPLLAAAMTVFMLSLTGMPPTLGLVGKFYLFRTAIQGGFIGLAIIGVLTSLISAYYYLRVVVTMYMREGEPESTREPWLDLTWGLTALATVVPVLPAHGALRLGQRGGVETVLGKEKIGSERTAATPPPSFYYPLTLGGTIPGQPVYNYRMVHYETCHLLRETFPK